MFHVCGSIVEPLITVLSNTLTWFFWMPSVGVKKVPASGLHKSGLRKPLFSDGYAQGLAKVDGSSVGPGDELAATSRFDAGF
uniref:Uncharacterized protein n=1 Tax=Triticum urartu TaxID=4572 RepID=A0A8R7U1B9_TRIUA